MSDIESDLPECKSILQLIMYKVDRTLAILGVIAIAMQSMHAIKPDIASQIAIAGISGLVGYIGGRSGK